MSLYFLVKFLNKIIYSKSDNSFNLYECKGRIRFYEPTLDYYLNQFKKIVRIWGYKFLRIMNLLRDYCDLPEKKLSKDLNPPIIKEYSVFMITNNKIYPRPIKAIKSSFNWERSNVKFWRILENPKVQKLKEIGHSNIWDELLHCKLNTSKLNLIERLTNILKILHFWNTYFFIRKRARWWKDFISSRLIILFSTII